MARICRLIQSRYFYEVNMELLENERIDDLKFRGLSIIQRSDGFCFGCDAVFLSHFATLKKSDKVLDLCTGTGIIPLLLYGRYSPEFIYGIEIIPEIAKMAQRSVIHNNIKNIEIIIYHCYNRR